MKKITSATLAAVLVLASLVSPQTTTAHGHTSFEIKGKMYAFTVGSLNEPVSVDDKSGVDLRVTSMAHGLGGHTDGHTGTPVEGLDKTLKVELMAGDKTKVLNFSPAYEEPGAYQAHFIPTVQTTYSYRIFGTIDGVEFNYTFTCNPAGHPQSATDKSVVEVSPGVKRIESSGAFGCPSAKGDMGFPEPSQTMYELNKTVRNIKANVITAQTFGIIGMTFGIMALAAANKARKTKKE
jgi:hypothetical protein